MDKELNILILAAGKSSRIRLNKSKIFLEINSKTLLEHSIEFARKLEPKNLYIIINPKFKFLEKKIKNCKFIYQSKPSGTGSAVKQFLKKKPKENKLLVTYADTPFLNIKSAKKIIKRLDHVDLVLYSFMSKNNKNYGLIKKDKNNKIMEIIEYSTANKFDRKIQLCNSGMVGISKKNYKNIFNIKKNAISKECYLTDIVKISYKKKVSIENIVEHNKKYLIGVNTLKDFINLKKKIRDKK